MAMFRCGGGKSFETPEFIKRIGSIGIKGALNTTITNDCDKDAYYGLWVNFPSASSTEKHTVTVIQNGKEYKNTKSGTVAQGWMLKLKNGESFVLKVTSDTYTNASYIITVYG